MLLDGISYFLRATAPYDIPEHRPLLLVDRRRIFYSWLAGIYGWSSWHLQYTTFSELTTSTWFYPPQMWRLWWESWEKFIPWESLGLLLASNSADLHFSMNTDKELVRHLSVHCIEYHHLSSHELHKVSVSSALPSFPHFMSLAPRRCLESFLKWPGKKASGRMSLHCMIARFLNWPIGLYSSWTKLSPERLKTLWFIVRNS